MKKVLFSCFATISLCSFAAYADQMTGYVSDAHCGAAHNSASAANSKCIEGCLKKGSDPVLVSDGKVMKFTPDSATKARSFAGQDVKIDGSMDGDLVKINSIQKAQ
ncbi:MAG: hypothetical protein JO270_15150 [Acidobacteriaceae bacterium]|nr:hypothetical protein [Acidobacteriaceae bacterium]MBV8571222.1 hypothetical protein [Acidobacteriaceae bacterium]